MRQIAGKRRLGLALVPFLALAGCAGDAAEEGAMEEPGVVAEEPEMAAEPAGARVEIVEPAEGATVPGADVRVVLATEGAQVEAADNRQTPGRGHHHLFIDEEVSSPTEPVPPTSETIIHMGNGAEEFVIPTLAPGPHRVIAVFAYGDHVPNTEVAQDTVNFTVAPAQ